MSRKIAAMAMSAALAMPMAAQAQTAVASVGASATVEANLQVTSLQDLAFGTLTPGSGAVITPGSAPGGAGQQMGVLQIDHNSDLIVSAVVPAGLSLAGFPDLPVAFSCGYSNTAAGALSGAAAGCNALPGVTYAGVGAQVTTYVQMGGTILGADTNNRAPGIYTGSVVFTVTANY